MQSLQIRLTYLSGKGLAAAKVEKDPLVRKLRADIRTLKGRIRAIDGTEKRMAVTYSPDRGGRQC